MRSLRSWLVDTAVPGNKKMVQAASNQRDFYMVNKREPNPWGYAKYHCRTGANVYSEIYWAYYPGITRKER